MKNLVIVESPAKAKTISKYLGADYVVTSCMGHIVDLPQKKLGIDVDEQFKADYVVIPARKKVLSELKKKAKDTEKIYIATDPDREGEAIGWNIKERLNAKNGQFLRVVFHEITQQAIVEAFQHPGEFDTNKIQAQQARRILDRLVGYFLSPLLWKKIFRGLSAGRVQSVALRIIVEREREIMKFVPQEYWHVDAELTEKEGQQSFLARLEKRSDAKVEINNEQEAQDVVQRIKQEQFVVDDIGLQKRKKSPSAPFITSTLQQEAFNKLGFSTTKTMFIAQQLYEGVELGEEGATGLITYMRTDSTRLADAAIEHIRTLIKEQFGKEYLPEKPHEYKVTKRAQEAHEAIRPTDCFRQPRTIKDYLSPDQYKLYELIWNRAVASQMKSAVYEITSYSIRAGEFMFKATGSQLLFKGFGLIYNLGSDDDKVALPALSKGQALTLVDAQCSQHFTKPPARYSEGSLVKALEEDGVGRPSTYAPVIRTILARNYIHRVKGYLHPTELGFRVNDLLVEYFPNIMDVAFTAQMEDELDRVEEGKYNWVNILHEFYQPFKEKLDFASKTIKKEIVYSDEKCDQCGKQLVVKWGRRGKFLSCSDYPRCKFSKSISTGKACPNEGCGGQLVERRSSKGRVFYGCSRFPECRYTSNKLPE